MSDIVIIFGMINFFVEDVKSNTITQKIFI